MQQGLGPRGRVGLAALRGSFLFQGLTCLLRHRLSRRFIRHCGPLILGACIGPDFGSLLPVRLRQQAEFDGVDFDLARSDFVDGSISRTEGFAVMKRSNDRKPLCNSWDDLRAVGIVPK
jgi:hypothetical protein